jgi:hypothetical protein
MSMIKNVSGQYPVRLQGTITFDVGGTGNYTIGETVTGSGGFSAKVVKWTAATRKLVVKTIAGTPTGVITGGTSSAAWTTATVTNATVGTLGVATGGWNLRVTDAGIARSRAAGARTLVEVEVASKGMATRRTDFATVPTFALTAITSSGVLDVSEADVVTFTITASEAIKVTGAPTYAFNLGVNTRTATFASMAGNVMTFSYTVVTADESADSDIVVSAGNFAFPSGASFADINGQSLLAMSGTIGATGGPLTLADQVVVA